MSNPEKSRAGGTDAMGVKSSNTNGTENGGQSTSKFRERWMKSKLEMKGSVRPPKTEEKYSAGASNGTQVPRNFEQFQTAALKTYENTMTQLQTNLPHLVRLSLFSRFDQVAKTLATVQFERDSKQETGYPNDGSYELASQQLSTKLQQMHHCLRFDLMKEPNGHKGEETSGHLLDGSVDLRRKEEERRAEEEQKRREKEERKLLDIERQREEQAVKCHHEECEALEAKRSLMEANKMLLGVEMKRKEEEEAMTEKAKKNFELLRMQLVEAQRKLEEIQRKQTESHKAFTAEKIENYGKGAKSNDLERQKPSEAGVHKGAQIPGDPSFSGKAHGISQVSKNREGAACKQPLIDSTAQHQEELVKELTEKAERLIEEKLASYAKEIHILSQEDFMAYWDKARSAVVIQLELDLMTSKKLSPIRAVSTTKKAVDLLLPTKAWRKRSAVNQENKEKIRQNMERSLAEFKDSISDISRIDCGSKRRISSKKSSTLTEVRLSFTCTKGEEKVKLMNEMEEKLDKVIKNLEEGHIMDDSKLEAKPVHRAGKKLTQLERQEIENRWKGQSQFLQLKRDTDEEVTKQQTKGEKLSVIASKDRTEKVQTDSNDQQHLSAKTTLMDTLHQCVTIYNNSTKELQVGALPERLASFSDCDKAARTEAIVSTVKDLVHESKAAATPIKLQDSHENELPKLLDKACNERRKALLNEEKAVKAKEAEEKVRIEEIQRRRRQKSEGKWRRDIERWEAERKAKEEESAKQQKEEQAPINVPNKEFGSGQTPHPEQTMLLRPESGKKSNKVRESASASPTHVPVITETATTIPSAELAIHIGLNRTRVGYVIPRTGTFFIVADVENCLYLKRNEFVVAFTNDGVKKLGNPAIDFKGSILHDSPHKLYTVINEERQFYLRLQEILAKFFLCLRCEAEMALKKYFRECVIAVPQCLNLIQRCCIEDGAMISGFERIQFVNDTNAIAVAFFVDSHKNSGNVVVVNGSEETFDIASFDFSSSKLQCLGVTGNYFYPDVTLEAWSVRIRTFFQNPIQRYFSENELGVDPTSPDTTYLMLDGLGEMFADYLNVVSRLTAGREDGLIFVDSHAVLKGAAYLCCLRSRDPSNAILQVWTGKLHAKHGTSIENQLRKVEEKIIAQKNRIKKVSKNAERGEALTTNEVRQKRKSLSSEYVSTIHNAKMDLWNAMAKLEMELPTSHPNFQRMIYESRLEKVQEQLFLKEDLTLEQLHKMKEEAMRMFNNAAA